MRKLFLILIAGTLSSCSTIMRDNTQSVLIKSNEVNLNMTPIKFM